MSNRFKAIYEALQRAELAALQRAELAALPDPEELKIIRAQALREILRYLAEGDMR